MEEIVNALNENRNLTEEIKLRIKNDIINLINIFPNIDKTNISEKLKDLKIEALPKLGEYEDVKSLGNSEILLSKTAVENKDVYNITTQCLLKALFPNTNPKLEALHNGMTEMIANSIVGNSSESDEYYTCELLSLVIDPENNNEDILTNAYLNGNFSLIIPFLEDKLGKEMTNDFLNMSNQNYMTRNNDSQSLFPEMEKYLINAFFKQNPSIKASNDFDGKLVLDSRFFDDKANRYIGLFEVADYYDNLRLNYYTNYEQKEQVKTI